MEVRLYRRGPKRPASLAARREQQPCTFVAEVTVNASYTLLIAQATVCGPFQEKQPLHIRLR
jgi:hypothetical protein